MNLHEFLSTIFKQNIFLWVEQGKLKFRAPKGGIPDEISQQIKQYRNEIIEILSGLNTESATVNIREVKHRQAYAPLSFEQERLWFLEQLYDGVGMFNMLYAFEFVGELQIPALNYALNQLLTRHQVLRSKIVVENDVPVQQPLAIYDGAITLEDFHSVTAEDYPSVVSGLAAKEFEKQFELTEGKVFRTRLLKFSDRCVLIMAMHHIVIDAWSYQLMLQELAQAYNAYLKGTATPQPPGLQYMDYAVWQRERLASGELQASIDFWTKKSKNLSHDCTIPADFDRTHQQRFSGSYFNYEFPAHLQQQLRQFSATNKTTVSTLLLAVYAYLISLHSGSPNVSLGIPTMGRDNKDLHDIIGFFVNAIIFQMQIPKGDTVLAYLGRVKSQMLDASAHQNVPAQFIIETLNKDRNSGEHLNISLAFNFVEDGDLRQQVNFDGIDITPISLALDVTAKHDLTFYFESSNAGLSCRIEYNDGLYRRSTVETLSRDFEHLLNAFLQEPNAPLYAIGLNSPADILNAVQARQHNAKKAFVLSPTQRDIYLSAISHPDTQKNNVGYVFELPADIDVERWRACVQQATAQFEILRIRMIDIAQGRQAGFYQWVSSHNHIDFEYHDMSTNSSANAQQLEQFFRDFWRLPFDLHLGPLHRTAVVKVNEQKIVSLFSAHHVLFDGASVHHYAKLLKDLYLQNPDGKVRDYSADLFAAHCTAKNVVTDTDATLAYWRSELANISHLASVQHGKESGLQQQSEFLSGEQWLAIKTYCKRNRITPTLFLEGLYGILLAYYFPDETDFFISDFSLGRNAKEQTSFGCYYGQHPFVFTRAGFAHPASLEDFWTLLRQKHKARKSYLNLSVHALNQIVQPHSLSFLFNFNAYITHFDEFYGRQQGEIPQIEHAVQLYIKEEEHQISLNLLSPPGVFYDQHFIQRYAHLANALATQAFTCMGQLPYLLAGEVALLKNWCGTPGWENKENVLARFNEQVKTCGDKIALVGDDASYTYIQLDRASDYLTSHLRARGLGIGDKLGILLPRDSRYVVALLAAVKAQASYVPLDPGHPQARLDYILNDAGISLLLTDEFCQPLVNYETERCVLWEPQLVESPAHIAPLQSAPRANAELYMIYTSGTTGNPKGVVISESNLLSLFDGCETLFDFSPQDRWSTFHSFAFDFSVWEVWGALLTGGSTHIVPSELTKDQKLFRQWLANEKISVLSQTPSAFITLDFADAGFADGGLNALRYIVFGGEALDINLLRPWYQRYGADTPILVNMYGITEITVHATFHAISDLDFANAYNTIGKPLPHLRMLLLGRDLRPVPPGFAGELFISGPSIAQGYHQRPELTSERFVSLSVLDETPERYYRTGDQAMYLADGRLKFLGRNDRQIKLRGYRIELDEIENTLKALAQVQACAVTTREKDQHVYIAAYVVFYDQPLDGQQLGAALAEHLPGYMIPSAFVVLETLPLTGNGKVDYNKLPDPRHLDIKEGSYIAPATDTEHALATIYAGLLGRPQVGRFDNFFELGGHSLMATQLASRIQDKFHIDISVRTIFTSPVVEALARFIDNQRITDTATPIGPIIRIQRGGSYNLSYSQKRLWFLHQVNPDDPFYNVPFVISFEHLDVTSFVQTARYILERHEVLRSNFVTMEEGKAKVVIQSITPEWQLPYEDLSSLNETQRRERIEHIIEKNATTPFNLESDPLLRCQLLFTGKDYLFIAAIHHIVVDGWSLQLLKREFRIAYQAFSTNATPELPLLDVQFVDFAHWQNQQLSGDNLTRYLDYWRASLADLEPQNFPSDRIRPAQLSYDGDYFPIVLDEALCRDVRQRAREQGVSTFMWMISVFYALLYRYTGQQDLCVGTPIANRNHIALESLVGFFVNTLALRVKVGEGSSFNELLAQVHHTTLGAYEHQDLPFDLLVDHLNIVRDPSRNPLFQMMFVMQNMPENILGETGNDEPGRVMDLQHYSAILDLRMEFFDSPEGIRGGVEYNVALFDRDTIDAFCSSYMCLLKAVLENPDHALERYPLLSPAAQTQQLVQFNSTDVDFSMDVRLHDLLHEQYVKTPENIALHFEGQHMSYAELHRESEILATLLSERGIGADSLVGVAMERSLELVVALLGILKAGGAYVPIDPDHPQQRNDYVLSQSEIEVIITQSTLVHDFNISQFKLVVMGNGHVQSCFDGCVTTPTNGVCKPDHLAYVIYTSGSTGRPKGVMNSHRGVVNRLRWMQRQYPLGNSDVVMQKTPYSFDVSVWEFFWPLMTGATLCIAKPGGHKEPQYLLELIHTYAITTLHFVPSMLNAFLKHGDMSSCQSLKRIFCSGEALSKTLELKCLASLPETELHNLYGPTEVAIDVSYWHCQGEAANRGVPIGYPIANTRLYILDKQLALLPRGAVGELYIGGIGLARGYLKLPEVTANAFIQQPSDTGENRLYKTGDLARLRSDGALEYHGRTDHQVKIRGLRIELEEIETTLRQHGDVADVAVVASKTGNNTKGNDGNDDALFAYIALNNPSTSHEESNRHVANSPIARASKTDAWASVFNEVYDGSNDHTDTSNYIGWNSTYTGEPIPRELMDTWVNNTVQRISKICGKHVLEIGCGTGLLLFRLYDKCERYTATDISNTSINYLSERLPGRGIDNVELHRLATHQVEEIPVAQVDTVIVNSVIQYFPTIDYAKQVIHTLIDKIGPSGGHLFLGDIRHYGLQKAFYCGVAAYQCTDEYDLAYIGARIEEALRQESELLINPVFFQHLCMQHVRHLNCQILLKQEDNETEMSRYCYDVIIHVDQPESKATSNEVVSHEVSELLQGPGLAALDRNKAHWIKAIANPRVAADLHIAMSLADIEQDNPGTPGTYIANHHLELLLEQAKQHHWNCEISWNPDAVGCVDLLLLDTDFKGSIFLSQLQKLPSIEQYANVPVNIERQRLVTRELREKMMEVLPSYMVPQQFIFMDKLPLTASGKLDRKALLTRIGKPTQGNHKGFLAPKSPTEQKMAELWISLLDTSRVSLNDNFFDLGGHSLLGIELMAGVANKFGCKLPMITLFNYPGFREFCDYVDRHCDNPDNFIAQQPTTTEKCLVALADNPGLPEIFLIHPGTGDVISYLPLAKAFSKYYNVWGLQLPGYDSQEANDQSYLQYTSLPQLAAHYVAQIQQVQKSGTYRLLGWSSGGLLALEIAQQLIAMGKTVESLNLIDTPVPDAQAYDYKLDHIPYLNPAKGDTLTEHPLYPLLNPLGITEKTDIAQINHKIGMVKYLRLLEGAYLPTPYAGVINLIVPQNKSMVEGGEVLEQRWRNLQGKQIHVCEIAGDHFSIMSPREITALAQLLIELNRQV